MIAQLGIDFQTWVTGLGSLQIALAALVVGLAILGYLRNESPAMLFLGIGIASLTIAPVLFRFVFQGLIGVQHSAVAALSLETLGLVFILYSIWIARTGR